MQASAGILWNKAELLMVPTKYGCSIRMWHDFTSVSALVRCAIAAQHMPSSFSRDSRQKVLYSGSQKYVPTLQAMSAHTKPLLQLG